MTIETHVGIQGVCAWPNLQRMQDGTLLATIFNQPCHGLWEGDLDCWVSLDEGQSWQFRGRPAPHEPGTNRMNCAVGLAGNGDLVADRLARIRCHLSLVRTVPWVARVSALDCR